jgi:hypothetical protein
LALACASGSIGAHQGDCAQCHVPQAQDFADSKLSQSATSPLFEALLAETEAVHGETSAALCESCHAPTVGHEQGLSCASCHAAVGNRIPENGELVHDLTGPVRGPTGFAPGAPHDTLAGDFANSSELCGTCHDVAGPAGFEESPYLHWQQASQSQAEPQGCADCHMQQGHRFEGLWSASAPELLASAMRLELTREGESLTVTVHNDNPGHNLPDGASYLRRLSLNIAGQDPIWLSTRLEREGQPEVSPNLADAQIQGSIPPLQSRSWTVQSPETTQVCVVFQSIEPALLTHLALDPALAGPEVRVLCQSG